MPRQPRYNLPGIAQHVIQRGNNRQAVFFDESDYRRYLEDLGKVAGSVGCDIHAYVLMTNHVHLLLTPQQDHALSRLMQGLGRRYVAYINRTYQRSGTLWEGRYKSGLVAEGDYVLTCMRYIELNPVRAGMVACPTDYKWSSHAVNAYGRAPDIDLVPHESFRVLGEDVEDGRGVYRALFSSQLDDDRIDEIRSVTNSCLLLGGDRLKAEIALQLNRRVCHGKAGRPRKSRIAV